MNEFKCEVCGINHDSEDELKCCCQVDLFEAIASLIELESKDHENYYATR